MLYAQRAVDGSSRDNVNEVLAAAQEWAGCTPIDHKDRQVWRKRVSNVERGLFDLAQMRANAFFGTVWRFKLHGPSAINPVPGQQQSKRKLDAMEGTLKRARKDAEHPSKILLVVSAVVPGVCATRVVQFIA